MQIHHDPDRTIAEVARRTCFRHRMNPSLIIASCTCSVTGYVARTATDVEYRERRRERLTKRREELLEDLHEVELELKDN